MFSIILPLQQIVRSHTLDNNISGEFSIQENLLPILTY